MIPVQVIADKLVVACDVSTVHRRLPVNLFIDFESTAGLELHNQAAAGLRSENADGSTTPITVHLPGVELTVQRREIGDDPFLDPLHQVGNSKELGENSVVGTIGSELLRDFHVAFDLGAGVVELGAPRAKSDVPPEEVEGLITLPVSILNDVVWMPVRYGDGASRARSRSAARATTRPSTRSSPGTSDIRRETSARSAWEASTSASTSPSVPPRVNYIHPRPRARRHRARAARIVSASRSTASTGS